MKLFKVVWWRKLNLIWVLRNEEDFNKEKNDSEVHMNVKQMWQQRCTEQEGT